MTILTFHDSDIDDSLVGFFITAFKGIVLRCLLPAVAAAMKAFHFTH